MLLLKESYAPVILEARKNAYEREERTSSKYHFAGEDDRPLRVKLLASMQRPLKILFTQPIVLIMVT